MRSRRSPEVRDLEDQLGFINYSPVAPTIRAPRPRHRQIFRIEPFLRPISLGHASWIGFLVFWLVFGRIMVFWLMMGGFAGPTKGVELRLWSTVEATDLERARDGATVQDERGRNILDPDRDSIHELAVTVGLHEHRDLGYRLCSVCERAAISGKRLVVAIVTHGDASYQDFVSAIDAVNFGDPACGCDARAVIVTGDPLRGR